MLCEYMHAWGCVSERRRKPVWACGRSLLLWLVLTRFGWVTAGALGRISTALWKHRNTMSTRTLMQHPFRFNRDQLTTCRNNYSINNSLFKIDCRACVQRLKSNIAIQRRLVEHNN